MHPRSGFRFRSTSSSNTAASSSGRSRSNSRTTRSLYARRGSALCGGGTGRGRRHAIPSARSHRRTVSGPAVTWCASSRTRASVAQHQRLRQYPKSRGVSVRTHATTTTAHPTSDGLAPAPLGRAARRRRRPRTAASSGRSWRSSRTGPRSPATRPGRRRATGRCGPAAGRCGSTALRYDGQQPLALAGAEGNTAAFHGSAPKGVASAPTTLDRATFCFKRSLFSCSNWPFLSTGRVDMSHSAGGRRNGHPDTWAA